MRVTWLALEWPRSDSHSGGVGRYVARMAQEVAKTVDLTVVTFSGAVEFPGMCFKFIPPPVGRIDRYYRSAWRARAAVECTKHDLVHAHGDDFFLKGSVPIIRTFYGLSLSEAYASRGLRRVNHFVLAGLERLAARRALTRLGIAVEAVDHFDCDHLMPPFFGSAPVGPRVPSMAPTIIFIGSFGGRKQGWLAQSAVAGLRERPQWRGARLLVVGSKDDASNWEPWVEHMSSLSDSEVSRLLSAAWLLVSPSSYEGFGIPIVEALAHGVAVVALANPGSSYIYNQAERATPLFLTDEVGFSEAVEERIVRGPLLNYQESAAASGLVANLSHAGSPERIVEIYRSTIAETSSKSM